MKPDEQKFLTHMANSLASDHKVRSGDGRYTREIVKDYVDQTGMPFKRAVYLLVKWTDKGWYNYGVNVMAGWMEPDGIKAAKEVSR